MDSSLQLNNERRPIIHGRSFIYEIDEEMMAKIKDFGNKVAPTLFNKGRELADTINIKAMNSVLGKIGEVGSKLHFEFLLQLILGEIDFQVNDTHGDIYDFHLKQFKVTFEVKTTKRHMDGRGSRQLIVHTGDLKDKEKRGYKPDVFIFCRSIWDYENRMPTNKVAVEGFCYVNELKPWVKGTFFRDKGEMIPKTNHLNKIPSYFRDIDVLHTDWSALKTWLEGRK